jgi:plastocyanin
VTVQIVGTGTFSFSPASITVAPGTIVKWINNTQAPHTVTGASFGSAIIAPGGTYTFTFNSAGSFAYHCSIHPYMTGTVKVT